MRSLCKSLKLALAGVVGSPVRAGFAFALLTVFSSVSADLPKTTARAQLDALRDEVRAAHARGDGPAYLAESQKMRQLLNDSPNGVLQVMSAQAFAGDSDRALDSFAQFVLPVQRGARQARNAVKLSLTITGSIPRPRSSSTIGRNAGSTGTVAT